jgi:hypothetical protein
MFCAWLPLSHRICAPSTMYFFFAALHAAILSAFVLITALPCIVFLLSRFDFRERETFQIPPEKTFRHVEPHDRLLPVLANPEYAFSEELPPVEYRLF